VHDMAQVQTATVAVHARRLWKRTKRAVRRYREVILILLTLAMSGAFLLYGYVIALMLESQHPHWFGNGY
jgi:hypothetical protein